MAAIVEKVGLDALLDALWQRAYTVIGPTVRSQSIVYDEVHSADDFPAGWVDVQEGGTFRLRRSGDDALFAHTVGHDSLKRFLFPPELRVWRARRPTPRASSPVCRNPFRSIILRAVEIVYALDEALRLLDAYEPPDSACGRGRPVRGCGVRLDRGAARPALAPVRDRRRRHDPRGADRASDLAEPGPDRAEPPRLRPSNTSSWPTTSCTCAASRPCAATTPASPARRTSCRLEIDRRRRGPRGRERPRRRWWTCGRVPNTSSSSMPRGRARPRAPCGAPRPAHSPCRCAACAPRRTPSACRTPSSWRDRWTACRAGSTSTRSRERVSSPATA